MRRSTAEKKLLGTYRKDRDKKRVQFATANGIAIKCPAYVRDSSKIAYAEWKAVVPHLIAEGVLKPTDVSILASYCLLYSRWREAAASVERDGQTILVTSTTRTGKTEKPIVNPAVRNEILYSAALVKIGTKLGLNPLDRSRIEASEADDDGKDPFEKFLDNDEDDPELDYLYK
jgi:P27 family predicted phage terminase small subunit